MAHALPLTALLEQLTQNMSASEIVASTQKAVIAERITEWRIAHHMNQREFASFMGVTQPTVSKWEDGDCNFTIDKLAEIACKLDLSLLVEMTDDNKQNIASVENQNATTTTGITCIGIVVPREGFKTSFSLSASFTKSVFKERM